MTAHRYWKLDNLTPMSDSYVAGAEVYIRQTSGGANEVPTSSTSSSSYSSGPSVLYDGNSSSWWASNSTPRYLAFDYGTAIDAVELMWQARPDNYGQACISGDLYWSDTSLTGPWTYKSQFTFSSWTANGQTQTTSLLLPAEMRVPEQHGYAVMTQTGELVTEQHGYAVMLNTGQFVTEQHGYAVLVPNTFTRRRQVMVGSV